MKHQKSTATNDISPLRDFRHRLSPAQQSMVLELDLVQPLLVEARLGQDMGFLSEGMGMNFPPSFQKGQDSAFPASEADWQRLLTHVDWLGLKILRYWLWGDKVFPRPGALQTGHLYLERLRRLDAWAQGRGGHLILDLSGMPEWLRYPVPAGDAKIADFMTAPRDVSDYVEKFALPLIKHVVEDLKLESVRYLCLVNEPFNVDCGLDTFHTPSGVDPFGRYVELHAELRRRLDEEGISRERLGLIGPDSHDLYLQALAEMRRRGHDILPHVEIMDEHAYRMRLDYQPQSHQMPTTTISELIPWVNASVATAREAGKPYLMTEYSCFYYATADGATRHDSTITEAEFVVRALAAGVGGALRYSLINSGEADGHWQCIETMDGSYAPVPNIYYAFALLSRYAPRGGRLRQLQLNAPEGREAYVHGVAIEYPVAGNEIESNLTILLVNDHPGELIGLDLCSEKIKPGFAWQTDATHKHRSIPVQQANERARIDLPPMSITALTTFDLKPDDPGLIAWTVPSQCDDSGELA